MIFRIGFRFLVCLMSLFFCDTLRYDFSSLSFSGFCEVKLLAQSLKFVI
ncbi:hypothetical protein LEP1GSC051_4034 [Leptospira sp. P2653]|nr:hypothetical protein LEP1GSC051_4034 [Leptospira sp. P2653]